MRVNRVGLRVTRIFEYVNLKYMKADLGNVRNICIKQDFTRATKHNHQIDDNKWLKQASEHLLICHSMYLCIYLYYILAVTVTVTMTVTVTVTVTVPAIPIAYWTGLCRFSFSHTQVCSTNKMCMYVCMYACIHIVVVCMYACVHM